MDPVLRAGLALLRIAVPQSEREWILGDTAEEFSRRAGESGSTAARRWMLGETLRAVAGAIRLRRTVRRCQQSANRESTMRTLLQDVRYAGRLLMRSPGFAALAIATLAIGIGANAAIFSVVHAVLMEPLPYAEPDRLVRVFEENPRYPKFPMAPGNFRDYRATLRSFEGLAAYERADLQAGGDRPEQLRGMRVTPGFFTLLGWTPPLGRDFTADEEQSGRNDVVVLSHALWQRRFAADPSIVGRTVLLSDRPFVVAGVLAPGFQHVGSTFRSYGHGETVDVWWVRGIRPVPLPQDRHQHFLNVIGRLRAGVALAQAQEELTAAAAELARQHPVSNGSWTARLSPLRDEIVGSVEPMLLVLLAAVQIVLLLACVNVAGLLLGRATLRGREIGVRAALGATRTRLVRQLAVESLVLAVAGGVLGIALAALVVRLLPVLGPADTPRLAAAAIDWQVMAFALAATFATALIFGLVPALQLARASTNDTLKHGGRGGATGTHSRTRGLLVAAEIALAFVLVAGAGLLLRSFVKLSAVDHGFRAGQVLTARVSLPQARYPEPAAAAFYARLRGRVATLPGVVDVGLASSLPWTGYDENTSIRIVGRTFPPRQAPQARYHMVTPGYFAALRIPLVAGRHIGETDVDPQPPVVVVNERLARRFWSAPEAAVGARLDVWGQERTVVGVVGNVGDTPWAEAAADALYFPQAQESHGQDMMLAIRAGAEPRSLVEPLMRAVRDIDPGLPLGHVMPLTDVAGRALEARRFLLLLVMAFGATALFLAVVGVYGVMAQAVGERVREFGVRQALGASPADILRLVMRNAATLGLAGSAAGLALAFASTRMLQASLYGVQATDPLTFFSVAALLLAVALAAAYLPARRAMRVDPASALRAE